MKSIILMIQIAFLLVLMPKVQAQQKQDQKLHVIIIGAHPDDPDGAGGVAYKWAQLGYDVMMVSLTNGDAGHQSIPAEKLAKIRREEARKAGEVIGVKYITLDNHDGQLMPTYENRLQVIRLIREQKADIVIFPRPYDYHPDHRYTGVLVLDAAYMVTVPTILPEVPFLKKNPMFLFMSDGFQHPEPFKADVAIDIDDVIEKKWICIISTLHRCMSGCLSIRVSSTRSLPLTQIGGYGLEKQEKASSTPLLIVPN
jgi:Uncharacterized proteins, LmbE homologs